MENEMIDRRIKFRGDYLKLTDEQWEMLLQLAAATGSLAPTGTSAGQPSWRTLIKRIADGEFILLPNNGGESK